MTDLKYSRRMYQYVKSVRTYAEALTELVTNSDDAYSRAGAGNYKTYVTLDVNRRELTVVDNALGMTEAEMRQKLGVVGDFTAESDAVRGSFSRGAKDITRLGQAQFTGIKDGQIATVTLTTQDTIDVTNASRPVTAIERLRYNVPANGLVVCLHFVDAFRLPTEAEFRDVVNYYPLRDIFSDPAKYLWFAYVGADGVTNNARLQFEAPPVKSLALVDSTFHVPNWPGATARFRLWHRLAPGDVGRHRSKRDYGVVVATSTSIHEWTTFYSDLETHPMMPMLVGRLECDYIDTLMLEFDQSVANERNVFPLVSHSRHGLDREHPFWKDLVRIPYAQTKYVVDDLMQSKLNSDELMIDIGSMLSQLDVNVETIWKTLEDLTGSFVKTDRAGMEKVLSRYEDQVLDTPAASKYDFSKLSELERTEAADLNPERHRLKINLLELDDVSFNAYVVRSVLVIDVNVNDVIMKSCLTFPEVDAKEKTYGIRDMPRFIDRLSGYVSRVFAEKVSGEEDVDETGAPAVDVATFARPRRLEYKFMGPIHTLFETTPKLVTGMITQ